MSLAKTTATCPFCKEVIHPQAVKCKHCQSELVSAKKQKESFLAQYNTFRYGFLGGVIFAVVMAVLLYFQFFRD